MCVCVYALSAVPCVFSLTLMALPTLNFLMALIALRTGLPYRPLARPDRLATLGTTKELLQGILARYPSKVPLRDNPAPTYLPRTIIAISPNRSAGATFTLRVEESISPEEESSCRRAAVSFITSVCHL